MIEVVFLFRLGFAVQEAEPDRGHSFPAQPFAISILNLIERPDEGAGITELRQLLAGLAEPVILWRIGIAQFGSHQAHDRAHLFYVLAGLMNGFVALRAIFYP